MKLLLIEDDRILRRELARELDSNGYEVKLADDFDRIEDYVKSGDYKLLLLDISLPGRDGYEICRSIRQFSKIPIMFLTSRDSDMDELYGMTLGGDDYIRKPYNMPILLARVAALLRRSGAGPSEDRSLHWEDFYLCPAKGKLCRGAKEIILTRQESLLLAYLFSHPREIVKRVDLIEELWDNQVYIDDNTLSVHMTRLRSKLKDLGDGNLIQTRYGQGYQL